jgi:hypothetical protein
MVGAYHLARLACGLLLAVSTYAFVARFTPWLAIRRSALLLSLFSSGLGWLSVLLGASSWLGSMPIDFWVPEGYLFLLAYVNPHLALAGAMLLGLLCLVVDAWRQRAWHLAALSGGVGLTLTAIVPFYTAVAYAVLGATWLAECILWQITNRGQPNAQHATRNTQPATHAQRLGMVLLSGAFSLPMAIYQMCLFLKDPIYGAWAAQNQTYSPHVLHYLSGYASLLLMAAGGVAWVLRRGDRSGGSVTRMALPLAWLLIAPVLVYLPFQAQRRLLIGAQVPLSLLAAVGIARYILLPFGRSQLARWLTRWPRYTLSGLRRWILSVVLLFSSITNGLLIAGGCAAAWTRSPYLFYERSEMEMMGWLRAHSEPGEVVLCAFETGNAIPAWAGNRVFLGHGSETAYADRKMAMVARFFDAATEDVWRRSLLETYQIAYVVVGPHERALGAFALDRVPYLRHVYGNDAYAIYHVEWKP